MKTHGYAKRGGKATPTYASWRSMINRCTNPKVRGYDRYGGRGITVCERWLDSFENFLEDMGERPVGKTIDRADNSGNYTPDNCKWATRSEQARNMRTNLIVVCNGVSMTAIEAAEKCGHNYNTLTAYLYHHRDFKGDVADLKFEPLKKLTAEKAEEIRQSGLSRRKLAAQFGVSQWTVQSIKRGKCWATP
mgnify:CR=1 FL=1